MSAPPQGGGSADGRFHRGRTALASPVAAAHHRLIEVATREERNRVVLLDRTVVECAVIAVGWAAIVGVDGRATWRGIRIAIVTALVGSLALVHVRAARGRRARLAAGTTFALAALTLPASGTLAVAHAVKGDWGVRPVAASAVTIAAIALMIDAWRRILRGVSRRRRWLFVPAAAVAGLLATSAVFPAVYATNVPRPRLGTERPSDHGLTYRDVTFVTDDWVTLRGWYVPARNRAALVLVHGASSTRTSVLDHMEALAREGYGVLAFDARGHGESGGTAMEFGWYGERDIAAAVTFLEARSEVDHDRIGVVGLSMGGEEAIGALASDPRIGAVVAEGATNRVYGDKRWLADEFGIRGRIQLAIEWVTYGLAELLTTAHRPPTLADSLRAAAPRPALLIAAGNVADEVTVAQRLHDASPQNVTVWVVPNSDHTGALDADRREWTDRVTAFLNDELFEKPAIW